MLTGLRSDRNDLKRLQNAFKAMDTNKDGTLTKEEFLNTATSLSMHKFKEKGQDIKWNQVFENIDLDGDGRLDFHEFIAGAVEH